MGCSDDRDPPPPTGDGVPAHKVEEVARWILAIEDFAVTVDELRTRLDDGEWTPDEVFAGTLLMGARTVDPKYGGSGFHAVLQVQALRYFASQNDGADLVDALMYGILRVTFHRGDPLFELPAVDLSSLPAADGADELLLEAVDASAVQAATRACVALFRAGELSRLHDTLLELGPRRAHKLGHEAICTAKVLTALTDLPGRWCEDVYRAVVWALITQEQPADPERTDLWHQSRERVLVLPPSWTAGTEDVERVAEVVVAMRETTSPDAALAFVEGLIDSGLGPRSIWDGFVLAAAESAFGVSNYHALTSVQALRDGYLLASTDRVRLLLLLQAAMFIGLNHETVGVGAPLIETEAAPQTLDEALGSDRALGVTLPLGYLQSTGDRDSYVRDRGRVRERVRRVRHDHTPFGVVGVAACAPEHAWSHQRRSAGATPR